METFDYKFRAQQCQAFLRGTKSRFFFVIKSLAEVTQVGDEPHASGGREQCFNR
jgi:hypothetical protein